MIQGIFNTYFVANILADELIHRWLAGVESATSTRLDMYGGSEVAHVTGESQSAAHVMGGAQSDDFLSSVDWVSGDVGQSTKSVLRGLLSKDLDSEIERQTTSKKKTYNPLVTMEMRHKEVCLISHTPRHSSSKDSCRRPRAY